MLGQPQLCGFYCVHLRCTQRPGLLLLPQGQEGVGGGRRMGLKGQVFPFNI